MAEAIRIRAEAYPRAIVTIARPVWPPIRFLLRVARYWWRGLWFGKVFPILPGRLFVEGRFAGFLGSGEEITGKALAALTLANWETFKILLKWQKGVLAWPLVFGTLWTGMGWMGLFQEPVAGIMTVAGEIALAIAALAWLVVFPVGFLRARTPERFRGIRAWILLRLTGSSWLEPISVNGFGKGNPQGDHDHGVEALAEAPGNPQ